MALTLAENWSPRPGSREEQAQVCRVTNTAGFGEAAARGHPATTAHRNASYRVQGKQADSRPCRPPGPDEIWTTFAQALGRHVAGTVRGAGRSELTEAQVRKHFHEKRGVQLCQPEPDAASRPGASERPPCPSPRGQELDRAPPPVPCASAGARGLPRAPCSSARSASASTPLCQQLGLACKLPQLIPSRPSADP